MGGITYHWFLNYKYRPFEVINPGGGGKFSYIYIYIYIYIHFNALRFNVS